MLTMLKSELILVRTKQKHCANIPGTAEWTSKIKVLVKQIKKKSQLSAHRGVHFQDKSKLKKAEEGA